MVLRKACLEERYLILGVPDIGFIFLELLFYFIFSPLEAFGDFKIGYVGENICENF